MNTIWWMFIAVSIKLISCISSEFIESVGNEIAETNQLLFAHVVSKIFNSQILNVTFYLTEQKLFLSILNLTEKKFLSIIRFSDTENEI